MKTINKKQTKKTKIKMKRDGVSYSKQEDNNNWHNNSNDLHVN